VLGEGAGPVEPLDVGLRDQRRRVRVGVGGRLEHTPDRRRARHGVHHHRRPEPHRLLGVAAREDGVDRRPIGHRHRLVVADQREVPGECQQGRLAADGVEDGPAADPGRRRHGVEGGLGVAVRDEQPRRRLDDRPPRRAGPPRADLGPVGAPLGHRVLPVS
jgi:hypothetical protein